MVRIKKNPTALCMPQSVLCLFLNSVLLVALVCILSAPGLRGIRHSSSIGPTNATGSNGAVSTAGQGPPGLDYWWLTNIRDTPLRLDVATGKLKFPDRIKRLWIDVGVHKETGFMPYLEKEEDLFVIGFEPSKLWKPCRHERCVVLWGACTPDYDVVHLNVQGGGDLCNSVLAPNNDTTSKLWRGCVTQRVDQKTGEPVRLQVPGFPLHEVTRRIPDGIIVEYIKIDAQGYDLEVMKGALGAADRIQVVSLEAMDVVDRSKLLYHGQPTLNDIKEFLVENGWTFVKAGGNNKNIKEVNAYFVADKQHMGKVDGLVEPIVKQTSNGR